MKKKGTKFFFLRKRKGKNTKKHIFFGKIIEMKKMARKKETKRIEKKGKYKKVKRKGKKMKEKGLFI